MGRKAGICFAWENSHSRFFPSPQSTKELLADHAARQRRDHAQDRAGPGRGLTTAGGRG
jgi:hypothetical protein